jgi:survival of motor neuron-related-splicing factor 30
MDVESTLQEYQLQLEQVEIAIRSDPENIELEKLKQDLVEVIELTKELLNEDDSASSGGPPSKKFNSANPSQMKNLIGDDDGPMAKWKIGDKCLAIYRSDGK